MAFLTKKCAICEKWTAKFLALGGETYIHEELFKDGECPTPPSQMQIKIASDVQSERQAAELRLIQDIASKSSMRGEKAELVRQQTLIQRLSSHEGPSNQLVDYLCTVDYYIIDVKI